MVARKAVAMAKDVKRIVKVELVLISCMAFRDSRVLNER